MKYPLIQIHEQNVFCMRMMNGNISDHNTIYEFMHKVGSKRLKMKLISLLELWRRKGGHFNTLIIPSLFHFKRPLVKIGILRFLLK